MVFLTTRGIKSLLKLIDKKLDEKDVVKETLPVSETTTEPKPEFKPDMIRPEQLIRVIASHLQS